MPTSDSGSDKIYNLLIIQRMEEFFLANNKLIIGIENSWHSSELFAVSDELYFYKNIPPEVPSFRDRSLVSINSVV